MTAGEYLPVNANATEINFVVKLFVKCINPVVRELRRGINRTVITNLLKADQSKLHQLDLRRPHAGPQYRHANINNGQFSECAEGGLKAFMLFFFFKGFHR